MPEISVIVPIYNAEEYLSDCIDSILRQSFTDFELILVNDGSSDTSLAICEKYAVKDQRIYIVNQENKGQAAARNHGIKVAKGKWVHFVDADDVIHREMLRYLYSVVSGSNIRISMCGAVEDENIPECFEKEKECLFDVHSVNEDYLNYLYTDTVYRYWVVWGKLIDINIIQHIPFTEGKVYEDNAVVCQWLYEAKVIANTNQNMYFYRINKKGTTKQGFSIKRLDYLWALEEQLMFYERIRFKSMIEKIYKLYIANLTCVYNQVITELNDKKVAKRLRKKGKIVSQRLKNKVKRDKEEYLYTYGVFHPRIIKIYWKYKSIKNRIQKFYMRLLRIDREKKD